MHERPKVVRKGTIRSYLCGWPGGRQKSVVAGDCICCLCGPFWFFGFSKWIKHELCPNFIIIKPKKQNDKPATPNHFSISSLSDCETLSTVEFFFFNCDPLGPLLLQLLLQWSPSTTNPRVSLRPSSTVKPFNLSESSFGCEAPGSL